MPMWHPNSERAQLRDTADRFPALARRKFVSRILISRRGFKHFAGNSFAAGLWRAVFLVDPLAAPCRGERERPFRASCALCIVAIADHDHLRRVASAFSHGGHGFVLLPVQAFSALSIKWSGYEGFHRGFSLGAGAKSGGSRLLTQASTSRAEGQ